MSLAEKQAAVLAAELRCEGQREHARDTLDRLGAEFKRSATPLRIVVSGFALGVASGLRVPGAGPITTLGGQLISGPLMSMLTESVLPALLAGVTAAATVEAVEEEDPAPETEDVEVAQVEPEPEPEAPKRRRRRNRRVDA
jgi:hypothetical protein